MMENPATWGPLERAINEALREIDNGLAKPGFRVGLSRARQIADKLRADGLVKEPAEGTGPVF